LYVFKWNCGNTVDEASNFWRLRQVKEKLIN
jgi:hypothetical protein